MFIHSIFSVTTSSETNEEIVIKPVELNNTQHAAPSVSAEPLRLHVVLLQPMPKSFSNIPTPVTPITADEALQDVDHSRYPKRMAVNTARTDYAPQLVDQVASDIGYGDARPATWNDLYWHVIGKRQLKTEEERVKALFSWLCSIPIGVPAFVTIEELKKAVDENVQYAKEALAAKADNPPLDSPEVVVNKLTSGETTYFTVSEWSNTGVIVMFIYQPRQFQHFCVGDGGNIVSRSDYLRD